ncbi:MAG: MFS transporter [Gordonia sp. (in: high G+C Gram-positive bacteria)]
MSIRTTAGDGERFLDRTVNKSAIRLVPFLCLMFVMAFLDRTNIGFAQEQFRISTGISAAAYAFGAGVFFFGYALFEVPSNVLLHRFGARRWLSRIMVTWGIVASCMAFAHNETTFYLLRFLLGVTEAGLYPGVILYMTYWFPSRRRAQMNAFFQFGAPLSFVIGGPISGWLLQHSAGWFWAGSHGWQIMFIIQGAVTVVIGVIAWFYLTDRPETARWLSADEREVLVVAITAENRAKAEHGQSGTLKALVDWRVLYLCAVCFTIQVLGYGYNFYIPTQVANLLGTKVGTMVGVVTGIPAVVAIIGLAVVPRYAERIQKRRIIGTIVYASGAIGIVASAILSSNPALCIIALCVAYFGHIVVQPIFWANASTYLTGGAVASGIALIGALGNLGGFVGPNIREWATDRFGSDTAGLYVLGIFAAVGTVLFFFTRAVGIDKSAEVVAAQEAATEGVSAPAPHAAGQHS